MNFWKQLPKPILVLAPMADVTDAAFRRVIAKYGKPDVTWTEFVSADGLIRATPEGKVKLMKDLIFSDAERPIVAQLFSANPEYMKQAAALCKELGFDGIDINMGCPDKSIEKQGAGAAMMKDYANARAVIRAAKEGAGDLPVSVKTRVGYNKDELDLWLPELLAENPAVITVHARTRKDMSKVPAEWSYVSRAVAIRDALGSETLIFGNGDALSTDDARAKALEAGCDGVMLGRAIFGNPWLFAKQPVVENREDAKTIRHILEVMLEHTKHFQEILGDVKNFSIMKKHYKAYVVGWDEAKELRIKLMETNTYVEVETIVSEYLKSLK